MVRVQAAERVTPKMAPVEFVRKWGPGTKADKLNERAGAQSHFIDLCSVLGVPSPTDDEDDGYCFEQGFQGVAGRQLYADVWKRGCFAWEYKRPGEDLRQALQQLMQYALPLENPPLLVVSDRRRIEIHTHFTGWPSISHEIRHEELLEPKVVARLRQAFVEPEQFRPERSSRQLTTDLAARFAQVAAGLRGRGEDSFKVAHFLTQCVFCCFAEDVKLLKNNEFRQVVRRRQDPARLRRTLAELFTQMQTGGDFGVDEIAWFNGGLFAQVDVPALNPEEIKTLGEAAEADWRAIDPTILGTLFERGLDPEKSKLIGAHFTDPATIEKLIDPVLRKPLLAEWAAVRAEIAGLLSSRDYMNVRARGVPSKNPDLHPRYAALRSQASRAANKAEALFSAFLERLRNYRVLDPACGSGNFLYLALRALKDIELQANLEAEQVGLQRQLPQTGPQNVLGIERNEFAAELARATVWIGELQWMRDHGLTPDEKPVLKPLNQIACRDALIDSEGREAPWPRADVVIGNPPFVGNKKMRSELGSAYVETVRAKYSEVPAGADLVCYWFSKALAAVRRRQVQRVGLVATQAIRMGASRVVLDEVCKYSEIFAAWSDEPWINDGASLRVSLVCFGSGAKDRFLNGVPTSQISPALGASADLNLVGAVPLVANRGVAFQGSSKVGAFEISGDVARQWLLLPNPNGRPNSDVLRPWANGQSIARRPGDDWIVDFGTELSEVDASQYEAPFQHVLRCVKPERQWNNRESYRRYWWRHAEARSGMRTALRGLSRFLVTPRVAKHRYFAWLDATTLPDTRLYVIAREDDWTLGVLSSRMHTVWALANASKHGGERPTYNAESCFETFPFPVGVDAREQIAGAANALNALRERWLNPREFVKTAPEVVPAGLELSPYPERVLARAGHAAVLSKRTMNNLYNLRPAWLVSAHQQVDAAVAAAYRWQDYSADMPDVEILRRLMSLNRECAASEQIEGTLPLRFGPPTLAGVRGSTGAIQSTAGPGQPTKMSRRRLA